MSALGGMSESERQHVQARVRAAMNAQVVDGGRHQGGRAPYGYVAVDGGPHPNPRKATEGFRLRILDVEPISAEVMQRIFEEYLDGRGDRAIANGLNTDGIPCPSERRPDQNRHRLADGWQGSTVRSILENPRYTGYAVVGRWARSEELLDRDDVGAGHAVRFRRADVSRVVRRGPGRSAGCDRIRSLPRDSTDDSRGVQGHAGRSAAARARARLDESRSGPGAVVGITVVDLLTAGQAGRARKSAPWLCGAHAKEDRWS